MLSQAHDELTHPGAPKLRKRSARLGSFGRPHARSGGPHIQLTSTAGDCRAPPAIIVPTRWRAEHRAGPDATLTAPQSALVCPIC
jgi:hypothetical protein